MNDAFKRLAGLGAIKAWLGATDLASILLVEDLGREHLPLIRELADLAGTMPFVIVLSERP